MFNPLKIAKLDQPAATPVSTTILGKSFLTKKYKRVKLPPPPSGTLRLINFASASFLIDFTSGSISSNNLESTNLQNSSVEKLVFSLAQILAS